MSYLGLEVAPKGKTADGDIAPGSINASHLSPSLFLELQKISLHTHEGSISTILGSSATPEALRGYEPNERVEHYKVAWSGSAAAAASVALTFGTAFASAPTVIAIATGRSSADVKITTGTVTATGVTLYWKVDSGTLTSLNIDVIVIGR